MPAYVCFISSGVLPTATTLKPCSFSTYNNSHHVLKRANSNAHPRTITCSSSVSGHQYGLVLPPAVPQNGQKGDVKPTPIIIRPDELHRSSFPKDFIFGAGTSAIQIEGDGTEGGRGPSTGDFIIDAANGGKGVDSYNKFKEDVRLLKEMGIPYYRFSIAWPRLLPDGTLDKINPDGVNYYNNLLDELERNGITPFVTLFHFDLPEALQKRYNGFMDRRIIQDFSNYCDLCFRLFGNRIKHWMTINEAAAFVILSLTAEQKEDPINQFIVGHHILLAHAAVVKNYREKYQATQGGELGMAIISKWFEPRSLMSPDDQEAADISFDFLVGWFMHPLKYGEYPHHMKKWVRGLPEFSEEEKKSLKDSSDFFGINYYTGAFAQAVRSGQMELTKGVTDLRYLIVEGAERDGVLIGPAANGSDQIYIYPEGLLKLILHVKEYYGNIKMYVTENGCSSYSKITMSIPEAKAAGKLSEIEKELNDAQRLEYIQLHLQSLLLAMNEGANVQGYIVWSLLDNSEFGNYDIRFGLGFVDYHDDYKRYVKKSGKWYAGFLAPRREGSGMRPILMDKATAAIPQS
uniref:Beta-glucosidase n=1 Tax=Kalanchoe fedtschenkoi TaxID=63787 RepID=A0A7N0UMV5_KALFE